MSVRQAAEIAELLAQRGISRNALWDGGPAFVPSSGPLPTVELADACRITLLSPTERGVSRMEKKWEKEVERKRGQGGAAPPPADDDDDNVAGYADDAEDDGGYAPQVPTLPLVYISHAHEDREWAARMRLALEPAKVNVFLDSRIEAGEAWEQRIADEIEKSAVALVLVSQNYLASDFAMERELALFLDRQDAGEINIAWVAVGAALWEKTPLVELQAAADPGRPLDQMRRPEADKTIAEIARAVVDLAEARARQPEPEAAPSRPEASEGPVDIEELAGRPFRADRSVANGSSLAFLFEWHGRALVVGGDAHADVLEESLRRLTAERDIRRLHVDAFVVPHTGSRGNLSAELLGLLECDRYLISTNGAQFGHPDRDTVARIVTYGRSSPDARPVIVFNYRSEFNAIWDDPELRERYGYDTRYPDGDGGISFVFG